MPASCATPPKDKKAYAEAVGRQLVKEYGKKKFYSVSEVQNAAKTLKSVDWVCWGMCLYVSPSEFKEYHESIGEVCNYSEMKSEMATAVTGVTSDSWFDADLSWLEWPEIDVSHVFKIFD